MTQLDLDQLLNDTNFKSDRERARKIAELLHISEATAQSRLSRYKRGLMPYTSVTTSASLRLRPSLDASGLVASLPHLTGFVVYCIECVTPNHFYVGQSRQSLDRLTAHIYGRGAVFTKKHGVKNVFCFKQPQSETDTLRLEYLLYMRLKQFGMIVGGNEWKERHASMPSYATSLGY